MKDIDITQLVKEWAANLHGKARLIREGVRGMDESCDDLADIMERYCIAVEKRSRKRRGNTAPAQGGEGRPS
jgi:hypothetical protein